MTQQKKSVKKKTQTTPRQKKTPPIKGQIAKLLRHVPFTVPDFMLGLLHNRWEFYRDGYRTLLLVTLFSVCLNLLLVLALIIAISRPPVVNSFATTEDGRYIPMIPLSEPLSSPTTITEFAKDTALACNNFNHIDFLDQVATLRPRFTIGGYNAFMRELKQNKKKRYLEEVKGLSSPAMIGAPTIVKEGIGAANGAHYWIVEVRVIVDIRAQTGRRSDKKLVVLKVVRVPVTDSPAQIAIDFYNEE